MTGPNLRQTYFFYDVCVVDRIGLVNLLNIGNILVTLVHESRCVLKVGLAGAIIMLIPHGV